MKKKTMPKQCAAPARYGPDDGVLKNAVPFSAGGGVAHFISKHLHRLTLAGGWCAIFILAMIMSAMPGKAWGQVPDCSSCPAYVNTHVCVPGGLASTLHPTYLLPPAASANTQQKVIFTGNVTFSLTVPYTFAPGSEIILFPGVKIFVNSELILKNTKVTTCGTGDFWGGFEVSNTGKLRVLEGSVVEHMCGGIHLNSGAKAEIVGTEFSPNNFNNNYPALWAEGNAQLLGRGIAASQFSNTSALSSGCTLVGSNAPTAPYHVFLDNIKYLKIGADDKSPKKWQNTFFNTQASSIRAENSNVDIVNSSFSSVATTLQRPSVHLTVKPQTFGIFTANITGLGNNPDDNIHENTFQNVDIGVHSQHYSLNVKNAKFYRVYHGILMDPKSMANVSGGIKAIIENNRFKSFYYSAIWGQNVFFAQAFIKGNVTIDDAPVPGPYPNKPRVGIIWANGHPYSLEGVASISNNTHFDNPKISAAPSVYTSVGILLAQCTKAFAYGNKAYQNYLPGSGQVQQDPHSFKGIILYRAKNNTLLNNTIKGNFGPSIIGATGESVYRGIEVQEAPSNLIKCNDVEGMNEGIRFRGSDCVSQHMFKTNTMTNNKLGLYLDPGTIIGQQFNQDNKWPGATGGNDFEAKFDGMPTAGQINLSLFEINDPDINSDYWAVPREPQDWFKDPLTYTPKLNCLVGPADPGGDDRSESDIRAINGTFPNYKDYPGSGFDANLRAYEVLHNNPDLLGSGSPDAAFFNAHQYGNLGRIFRAKNDLERIGKVTTAFEATWVSNMDSISQTLADIAVQDSLYRESPDPAAQQQAAQNLTTLSAQLSSLQQTNQSLSAQYASDVAAKAAQLNTDLGAIVPANEWEQNVKTVISTLRQQVADGTSVWTTGQYDALNGVAGQCRHEGGIAVVMARAALQQFNYDDEAMCPGYTGSREKAAAQGLSVVKIVPNPADEQCLLSFERPVSGILSVMDVQGRAYFSLRLSQSASAHVDTRTLPNGIYFLHLLDDQGAPLLSQKLVVLH